MALRAKRSMGFGKFQSIVQVLLLILQTAVVGVADANSRNFQSPFVLEWACEPLWDAEDSLRISSARVPRLQTWGIGICNRIRGGRLGRGSKEARSRSTTNDTESSATSTVVLEKAPETSKVDYSRSPYTFSLFQNGDGSDQDPDGIPDRYMSMQGNKRDKAKKAMEATLSWRKEYDVDTILARPNPTFDVCKKVFPHYFCGRDETDRVILLQRPGMIDLPMAQANSITGDDLLWHYVYEMEYLWKILETAADATMTSVIDLTGVNLSILRKPELLNVVNMFCSTMDAHFPQRAHKTLLINAPKWFGAMYKLISPLLRESTKQKITILSKGKKQDEAIRLLLSKDCPISGDKNVEDLPPAEMEDDLRNFVIARLIEADVEMQKVVE